MSRKKSVIERRMKQTGITTKQIAQYLGKSERQVIDYVQHRVQTPAMYIIPICNLLGIAPEEYYQET